MEKIQGFPDLSQPPPRGHARICKPHLGSGLHRAGAARKEVYVATMLDLYTRRILGIQVAVRKGAALTIQALSNALLHHPRPGLFHSDNGREYDAMAFTEILDGCGIVISRSRRGALGRTDTRNRSTTNSRLTWRSEPVQNTGGASGGDLPHPVDYNNTRIHSALTCRLWYSPNGMR